MDKKTRQKICSWGKEVRESILDIISDYDELEYHFSSDDLTGACGLSSFALHKKLKSENIPSQINIGKWKTSPGEHVWITYDDTRFKKIIDVTATQFSLKKEVHITNINNKNYIYYDPQPALKIHLSMWDLQNPYLYNIEWDGDYCKIDLTKHGKTLLRK